LSNSITPPHGAFMDTGPEVMLILSIAIQIQVFQKVIDASFVTI
jgi:hypothetical protein